MFPTSVNAIQLAMEGTHPGIGEVVSQYIVFFAGSW